MELVPSGRDILVEGPAGKTIPLRQIICVGLNYRGHAREQGVKVPRRPLFFGKNLRAACLHESEIRVPWPCQSPEQVDFEGELALIIGQEARDVPRDGALRSILAFTCANDVSARWWQKEGAGGQYFRGKSFDTFCPLGPRLVAPQDVGDVRSLHIRTRVNGETMQDSTTADMIFDVPTLVSELSQGTTLSPGTVILTGTPAGVGMARTPPRFLQSGDVVEVEIAGIGTLRNRVVFE